MDVIPLFHIQKKMPYGLKFDRNRADIRTEENLNRQAVSGMTISAYQVDNVIKAYSKQSKARLHFDAPAVSAPDRYKDVVTLSGDEEIKADAYRKISYSLLDVVRK